ncbi:MAG: hypothetical protein V4724_18270 [Pseudomonadota bacterium]
MGTQINLAGLPLQEMWQKSDFDGLETQLQSWCKGKERFRDGRSKLLLFETSLHSMFINWKSWDADRAKLERWKAERPGTLSQAMAETIFWRAYAWNARGSGYAHKVPKEAWELFGQRMAMAGARLEQSKALSGACPLWHSLNITTLLESGAEREKIEAAYQRAVQAFPADLDIHAAMGRVYSSRWGGSDKAFDSFARRAAFLTRSVEGDGMYARLYWIEDCNCDTVIQFSQERKFPDWKLIKSGFQDLAQRYPGDAWNRNKFASFACRAYDKSTYLALRGELGKVIYPSLWPDSYSVEVCDRRFMVQT